jgi:hypothetical protein
VKLIHDLEPIRLGHSNIEQQQVRLELLDYGSGPRTIGATVSVAIERRTQ